MTSGQDTRSRHFYTDPQAVEWMEVKYGMSFYMGQSNIKRYVSLGVISVDGIEIIPAGHARKFAEYLDKLFIHPDSLHLLEPRQWDIGQRMQGVPQVVCTLDDYKEFSIHGVGRNYISLGSIRMDDYFRIIQRDGKPFFWPEVEA